MVEAMATATEMKNQFGECLQMVINGNEVIVTKLTDSLTGLLKGSCDYEDAREEALKEKYEIAD